MWLDSALFLASDHAARLEPELIGSLGERIAVHRDVWTGAPEGRKFELGGIRVTEVDAEGKLRALILFDSENRGVAFAEALARFASGEAAAGAWPASFAAFLRASAQHDWGAARRVTTPDFVLEDQRAPGMGTLDRGLFIRSMRAHAELGPGLAADLIRIHAWNRQGLVVTVRTHGTVRDGGPFENVFIALMLCAGDRLCRYVTFDVSDADRALARFDELCAERAAEA